MVRALRDVDRPDYFHFDLDLSGRRSSTGARIGACRPEGARNPGDALVSQNERLEGRAVYVPIKRGPTQKDVDVHQSARETLAEKFPNIRTLSIAVAKPGRHGGAGRLKPERMGADAPRYTRSGDERRQQVSTPVTWDEIERGITSEQFTMEVCGRVARRASSFARS